VRFLASISAPERLPGITSKTDGDPMDLTRTIGPSRLRPRDPTPRTCEEQGVEAAASSPSTLWAEFGTRLRGFLAARAPAGVDADDLLQEVFVRIQQHVGSVRDAEKIEAWIFQIARNVLADSLRGHQRRESLSEHLTEEPSPDDAAEEYRAAEAKLSSCMGELIERLPEPYRTAIRLTEMEGVTQAEAARLTGVSISGMKSRVQRGRERLKVILLDCCRIELDCRNAVVAYQRREAERCCDKPIKR
jgi:RNA polymerase sigma-70 factor, ECF subfamily